MAGRPRNDQKVRDLIVEGKITIRFSTVVKAESKDEALKIVDESAVFNVIVSAVNKKNKKVMVIVHDNPDVHLYVPKFLNYMGRKGGVR